MSSKNRTSLVADSDLDWIHTIFSSHDPIWNPAQYTPLVPNGRAGQSWRLVAAGLAGPWQGEVAFTLSVSDVGGPQDIADVTIPHFSGDGPNTFYLTAEVLRRLSPGTTDQYIYTAYGYLLAPGWNIPFQFGPSKAILDATTARTLICSVTSTDEDDDIEVGTVTLESLN